MKRILAALFAIMLTVMPSALYAVQPDEIMADPAQEARARNLSRELRCMVCQNQSIDDSDAALARDLRVLVRERLVAGDSDNEVIEYVVSRYGDFVLLKPPFKGATLILWGGPVLFVLIAFFAGLGFYRRQHRGVPSKPGAVALSNTERARLNDLLDKHGS